jgi:hypothetical protein
MNETQLIRRQLALEREHLAAVAQACAQAATQLPACAPFQQACEEYLACVLGWFAARDRRLSALAAGLGPEDPRCATVNEILARSGDSGQAQALLAAAAWPDLLQFLQGPWSARRDALEGLLAHDSRVIDWRQIGGIDADGILEERTRYAQVVALLPAGVSLAPPTRAA